MKLSIMELDLPPIWFFFFLVKSLNVASHQISFLLQTFNQEYGFEE
jgi:hypothetical protein